MVALLGLNSDGHSARTMSPKAMSGASTETTAPATFELETADHVVGRYHSRLPPASSSLAGLIQGRLASRK